MRLTLKESVLPRVNDRIGFAAKTAEVANDGIAGFAQFRLVTGTQSGLTMAHGLAIVVSFKPPLGFFEHEIDPAYGTPIGSCYLSY